MSTKGCGCRSMARFGARLRWRPCPVPTVRRRRSTIDQRTSKGIAKPRAAAVHRPSCWTGASAGRRGRRRHRRAPRRGARARRLHHRPGRDGHRSADAHRRRPTSCCSTSGLPDMDGSEVCRRVRAASSVPIIIVTARGDESDRVLGLELGADDYIVKPFGLRELVARVRAVSRRRAGSRTTIERPQRVGALEIDRRTRRVRVDGSEVVASAEGVRSARAARRGPGRGRQPSADHGRGVGPALVRADQDARRARRLAAQEARRSRLGSRTVRSVGFRLASTQ